MGASCEGEGILAGWEDTIQLVDCVPCSKCKLVNGKIYVFARNVCKASHSLEVKVTWKAILVASLDPEAEEYAFTFISKLYYQNQQKIILS